MNGPLCVRVEVLPEPRQDKPRVVVVVAAVSRAPVISDLESMPPPRGAMMPYPFGPSVATACTATVGNALAMGGTVALFVAPHDAASAERWLRRIALGVPS